MGPQPELINTQQAASLLGVSRQTLQAYVTSGDLTPVKGSQNNANLFPLHQVRELATQRAIAPALRAAIAEKRRQARLHRIEVLRAKLARLEAIHNRRKLGNER
jgi:DNA-binding transcriptional MerR regulator